MKGTSVVGYVSRKKPTGENIWFNNPPQTYEELLADPRYKEMPPLARDAAAAKILKMSYGQYQQYKVAHGIKSPVCW